MDFITRRPDHIEDVLIRLHSGQWFGWSDSKNKVYENLIIHDPEAQSPENKEMHGIWSTDKPTKKSLEDDLKRMQDEFDAQGYARNRVRAYPSWQEQMDMQYHDAVDGTTTWQDAVKAVKDANPKPE
jgi:hypothetical protein